MANVEKLAEDINNLNIRVDINNNNNIEDEVNEGEGSKLRKKEPKAENKIVVEESENKRAIIETDEVDGEDSNEDNKDTIKDNNEGANLVIDGHSEPEPEVKEPLEIIQESAPAPAAQVPRSSPFAVRSLIDCPEYFTAFDGSYPTAF